ncbi:MAG: oligosaccharide flippase family protein [Anaerocolumna sp.]
MGTSKKSDFIVQGSILAIASIIVRLIGLLYRLPLTNIIGDEGMGYYSQAFSIYNIALILSSYSLPLAVSKLVATRLANKEYKNSYRIFLCSLGFAVIVGILMSLLVFFGADFLATAIIKMPGSAIPLRILAPTIFVFAVMGVLRGYFQGKRTMIPTSVSQILEQIVNAIVSIIAAYYFMSQRSASESMAAYGAAGGTLGTFVGASVALIFLAFIFALYKPIIDRQMKKDKNSIRESYPDLMKALALTIIPVILSQTVYQLSGFLDGVIFSNVLYTKGVEETLRSSLWGIYSNKYSLLITVPVAVASSMAAATIPSMVSTRSRSSNVELKMKVHQVIKFNMLIAIPAAVGLGVLASPVIRLLFSDASRLPADLMRMGSVAVVFFALSTTTNAILQGIDNMRKPVIHAAISLGVHIVLLYIMLKVFNLGIYALVIGNVTFSLMVCILNWISVGKLLNYRQEVKKTFLIPTLCSLIMGAITYLVYSLLDTLLPSSISTIFAVMVGMAVYGVMLLLLKGVTESELIDMPMGRTLARIAVKLHLL